MRSVLCPAQSDAVAATRMLWLPGAFQMPQDFLDAGFAAQVRRRGLPIDLEFVDLGLEHVGDRSAIERLARASAAPARAAGCRRLWIGGISLGGMLALDYAATEAGAWDGLCLLSPYLGNRLMIGEIAAAGSLAAWQPDELAQADEERRIWRFARTRRAGARPIYLGYGMQDRFAAGHELLAATLPPQSVDAIEGGHDWSTWSQLFGRFLDSGSI